MVVHQQSEVPSTLDYGALVTLIVSHDNDIVLANLVNNVLACAKVKGSPLPLGLMQRPFKWIYFTPLKNGRKKDWEKIKIAGDVLIEFGVVKPLDVHFPHPTHW